jgi:hypothetical protein
MKKMRTPALVKCTAEATIESDDKIFKENTKCKRETIFAFVS